MPIVGSFAGASSRAYGLQAGIIVGDFESIATTTVGSTPQSSITFSSIPSTYSHLHIRAIGRYSDAGTGTDAVNMTFNSDTTYTNYRTHLLYGNGTSALSANEQSTTYFGITLPDFYRGGEAAGIFGCVIYDILDYANTNKHKTVRYLNGFEKNGAGNARLGSGVWLNSAAITSITFTPANGYSFGQYTQYALYGIKG
jgi:hypothetical protein